MRKTKDILLVCAALVALHSCDSLPQAETPVTDGRTVTLRAGAVLPGSAVTKGGPNDPVASIHAIVFDENGYLVEHATGEGLTVSGDEVAFTLSLTATSEPRRIHFVANHTPSSLPFGSEAQLIGTMTTSGGESAYWQYVDLPDGIADGEPYPSLRRIPMVRNSAAVTVTVADPSFTLKGYKIVNTPDEGSVAPWVPGTGPFAGYNSTSAPAYPTLHSAGYRGYVPPGAALLSDSGWVTGTSYIYEHPYTGDPSTYTYILLWGRLSDMDADSYYKMDIVDKSGTTAEYMDILRNIHYTMTINAIGSTGYRTPEEAASKPAGNNISGSVDTDALDNISDGSGQFFVSATELVIVDDSDVVIKYKFIPDAINAPTVSSNGGVTVDAPAGDVLASASTRAGSDDSSGWRSVTLHPRTPQGIVYSQTIRLTTPTGLTKTVRLRLRPKFDFTVSCTPTTVAQEIGEPVTVTVTLPEGLPQSCFPLQLVFSTADGTLNPDAGVNRLPVYIQDGRYGFAKEVRWSDYEESRTLTAAFVTNARRSATTVRVDNHYFNTGTASFTNSDRYVTSFTIMAYSLTVTNLSTFLGNTVNLYYDSARTSRVNNTNYTFRAYGLAENTTITVNSMKSTDRIYFYHTTRRTTASLTIEELEEGGHTLAF